jgi:hypothetical protein
MTLGAESAHIRSEADWLPGRQRFCFAAEARDIFPMSGPPAAHTRVGQAGKEGEATRKTEDYPNRQSEIV